MTAEAGKAGETLSHVDDQGRARMVDVGGKAETERVAVAEGRVLMQAQTWRLIEANAIEKGDVLGTARIAGIMAAKRTHELVPLCHPLLLTHVDVELSLGGSPSGASGGEPCVEIRATVRCSGKTGVEMEALTAVSIAALTVYDMAKAVDRGMRISDVRLRQKSGGRSGEIDLP